MAHTSFFLISVFKFYSFDNSLCFGVLKNILRDTVILLLLLVIMLLDQKLYQYTVIAYSAVYI